LWEIIFFSRLLQRKLSFFEFLVGRLNRSIM
jgi:hypothetical protein